MRGKIPARRAEGPHQRRGMKGDVTWFVQLAGVLAAFAIVVALAGSAIFSAQRTQEEVDKSVEAYRLASGINLLRTVDGGHVQRTFATPLTFAISGRDITVEDGKERTLKGYVIAARPGALGGAIRQGPFQKDTSVCIDKPLGGDIQVKPCPKA